MEEIIFVGKEEEGEREARGFRGFGMVEDRSGKTGGGLEGKGFCGYRWRGGSTCLPMKI